jgi:DNA modification methylase
VSRKFDREYVGIELNPEYIAIASNRLRTGEDRILRLAV